MNNHKYDGKNLCHINQYILVNFITKIFKTLYNFINLFGQNERNHHGNHVFADFVWDVTKDNLDGEDFSDHVFGDFVFETMKKCIQQTSMTIVHSKLCIYDPKITEPGFSSVHILDESHCATHCYSRKGLLAIDIFTCGITDPVPMIEFAVKEIQKKYPSLICTYKENHPRFHYMNKC